MYIYIYMQIFLSAYIYKCIYLSQRYCFKVSDTNFIRDISMGTQAVVWRLQVVIELLFLFYYPELPTFFLTSLQYSVELIVSQKR